MIVASPARAPLFAETPDFVEHEVADSKPFRFSRLPVPLDISSSSPLPSVIPAHQHTLFNSSSGQDVHYLVNNSTSSVKSPVISTIASNCPPVSRFPPPLTQNDLKHPIRRPWTHTKIFQSSSDLAAHYGIPQCLPPVPSTSFRQQPATTPSKERADLNDFFSLSQNYIKMLSNQDSDPVTTSPMQTPMSFMELSAPGPSPTEADPLDELAALIGM